MAGKNIITKNQIKKIDWDKVLIIGFYTAIVLTYILLHLKFNKEDVDDAWTLSFIYNSMVKHIAPEATFGSGLANIHLFGMTQAYLYSTMLNLIGWSKGHAHLISTLLIATSSFLWYQILKKLHFSKKTALLFSALLLWCEPVMQEANLARPESLTFLLISLSFYLFLAEQPLLSGLTALIAFENHPMGLTALIFIAAYILSNWKTLLSEKKKTVTIALMFLLGLVIGAAYYLFFHFQYIKGISGALYKASHGYQDAFLHDYFFGFAKYYRRVPEFIFFLACFIIFLVRKVWKKNPFVLLLLLFFIAVNFIIPRLNYNYALYFYVSFLLMSLTALNETRWLKIGIISLSIVYLAYYTSIFYRNYRFDFNKNTWLLQTAIPNDGRPIIGSPNEWFAFMDREFYSSTYTMFFNSNANAIYSIEDNNFRGLNKYDSQKGAYLEYFKVNYSETSITNINSSGENFEIKLLTKKK